MINKNLGHATAYAYYKAGGGTMTEAEFTEFMADFGTASQTAVEAAQAALASETAAQTAATTATNKATEATTAATTATTKAGEASTSASTATSAKDTAVSASQTATTKATEATTAAATATSAKTDAVAANTAAQSAKTAAQTAQTGAETAAASVQSSAAQIATNAEDISQLKSDILDISDYALKAFPTATVSGSVATFDDGANVPVKDMTVNIDYNADGVTGANIYVCRNNLYNPSWNEWTISSPYAYKPINAPYGTTMVTISLTEIDSTVDLSGIYFGVSKSAGTASGGVVWLISNGSLLHQNFTVVAGTYYYFALYEPTETAYNKVISRYSVQAEIGSTVNTYEEYEGAEYAIDWSSVATIYGGTVDPITGVLTSTYDSDGTTLDTAVEYTIDTTDIVALYGDNNIYADTGDISVTYRVDSASYVDEIDVFKNVPIDSDNFRIGNIGISSSGWSYGSSTTRVSTKIGVTYSLRAGDVIGLSDYTDARFYLGWKIADGTYGYKGWNTSDVTLTEDGEYVINISNITEATVSDKADLLDLLVITSADGTGNVTNTVIKGIESDISSLKESADSFVKSVNHRGWYYAPENTLVAYKESKLYGYKYVECDVRFTSDDYAVLIHDASINRTARDSDGNELSDTVNIADITYETALTYDFGIYQGSDYEGTTIPTFEEFIALCRKLSLHPYIELKVGTQAQIEGLVNTVKQYGMLDNVTWIGGSSTYLGYVTNAYSKARVGVLITTITSDTITTAQALQTGDNEVFIDSSTYTDSEVTLCSDADLPLEVWTIDLSSTVLALPEYVTGVTTDYLNIGYILYEDAMS